MKKKCIVVLVLALAMSMVACSYDQKEEAAAIAEPKATGIEVSETEASQEEVMDDRKEYTVLEETVEADPITGIVESYADNVIAIKDKGDGITYYFSTQGARVVEGNASIAIGDEVQITYQGLLGDEEHPGVAVKIMVASMYNEKTTE